MGSNKSVVFVRKLRGKTIKISGSTKRRVLLKLFLIYVIPIILIAGIIISTGLYAYKFIFNTALVATNLLDDLQVEADTQSYSSDKKHTIENSFPRYGIYPSDNTLRIKQEMIEICEKAGKVYGVPGKFVLAVAMMETSVHTNIPVLSRSNGSLYTDLCIEYAYQNRDRAKPFFIDSQYTGVYKDEGGNPIIDPLKVGKLDVSKEGAIGPFQFYSTYIKDSFTRIYDEKGGTVTARENQQFMGWFDEELGFLRPNPLYFPDAALNAAAKLAQDMRRHESYLKSVEGLNLPDSIKQEILFIYAADAYHGDTASMGEAAKRLHDVLADLYGKSYYRYTNVFGLTSLGDFSKAGYNRDEIRTLIGGTPFYKQVRGTSNIDFDGTFNHSSNVIKEDSNGKYLEIVGFRFYEPLCTEFGYQQLVANMPAASGIGTNNKFSWVYGFQALNMVNYYTNEWIEDIKVALKEQGGSPVIGIEVPYKVGSSSREDMLVAAFSLIGKVRYIWGGGHQGTNNIIGINPLWREFNRIYVNNNKEGYCIRPNNKGYWCPIHKATGNSKCAFYEPRYTTVEKFLKDRTTDYAAWDNPYGGISASVLSSILSEVRNVPYHALEGLDCSGFVGWVFNQTFTNRKYEGEAVKFISNNGLETIRATDMILPGDIISTDDHIQIVVGAIDNNNRAFVIIEATPPEVKCGVAYKKDATNEEIGKAERYAKEINNYFGDITYSASISKTNISKKSIKLGRASVDFTDKGFEDKLIDEIIEVMKNRIPDSLVGR